MSEKSKKKQKGFTLVEVIVVAVIVAILAAVAVPLYLNYIESSRTNAAENVAGSVASFCGSCRNADGTLEGYTSGSAITDGGSINCSSTSMGNTKTQIPDHINVTITNPGNMSDPTSTGTVAAEHEDGGSSKSYSW